MSHLYVKYMTPKKLFPFQLKEWVHWHYNNLYLNKTVSTVETGLFISHLTVHFSVPSSSASVSLWPMIRDFSVRRLKMIIWHIVFGGQLPPCAPPVAVPLAETIFLEGSHALSKNAHEAVPMKEQSQLACKYHFQLQWLMWQKNQQILQYILTPHMQCNILT